MRASSFAATVAVVAAVAFAAARPDAAPAGVSPRGLAAPDASAGVPAARVRLAQADAPAAAAPAPDAPAVAPRTQTPASVPAPSAAAAPAVAPAIREGTAGSPAAAAPPSAAPAPAAEAAAAAPAAEVDPAALAPGSLVLLTRSGRHEVTVEIADDPIERQVGLMFRSEMARDHGMLFDFAAEGERSFWMKNTILPLDLVFARADGTVVSIRHGTPQSLDSIPSDGPARFVLELNAGVAEALGLAPGDRLVHRRVAR